MSVMSLLRNLGFAEVWINQGVGNEQLFLVQLKHRLRYVLYTTGELDFVNILELIVLSFSNCR
jgi:hypothetical protein